MKKANIAILLDCLESINYYDCDDCEEIMSSVDFSDDREVKALIKYRIQLDFCMRTRGYQELFKDTLEYCLSKGDFDFESFIANSYVILLPPMTYRKFFGFIWEVFYGTELYHVSEDDMRNYEVLENWKDIEKM